MDYKTLLLSLYIFSVFTSSSAVQPQDSKHSSVSAIFVFGDSTVDPGNNNYIQTGLKSNFPPYGIDLPSHIATGRFTDGKLTTDFIASHLGIKDYVPPYLNKTLSTEELMTGVSFASAGTGYDPLTAQISNVIPMQIQLEYFKEYKARLEGVMGAHEMESHIRKAGFVVSCGTNDFAANYFLVPVRRKQYSITDYQSFLIQNLKNFMQGLMELGARKIGIVGVPPIGCLPIVVSLFSYNAVLQRGCIESYSNVAKQYNQKLQNEVEIMQKKLANSGFIIVYAGIFDPLLDIIESYKKFGFEEWRRGCCGSGLLETGYLCNPKSLLCPDPSKFIFWDSIHPTEKVSLLEDINLEMEKEIRRSKRKKAGKKPKRFDESASEDF